MRPHLSRPQAVPPHLGLFPWAQVGLALSQMKAGGQAPRPRPRPQQMSYLFACPPLTPRCTWGWPESTSQISYRPPSPSFCLAFAFFFFSFLGPHPRHMEVPRPGVESELQLLADTTATATQDLSRIFDLHHRSRQHWILNPLDATRVH